MRVAIMQPYFCPYIGYFQLVAAVDKFIFYDDVNFIKGGWINRNRIISNNKEFLFTIPLTDASSFRLIKDTQVNWKSKDISKFVANVDLSYRKAPFYNEVMPIVKDIFDARPDTISQLAIDSVIRFSQYLGLTTEFKVSSQGGYTKTEDRVQNLVNILNAEGGEHYINPIGGQELYATEDFSRHGVKLSFLKGTGSLSVIDVCMNTPREEIQQTLQNYTLL
jgi:hypothetical protein